MTWITLSRHTLKWVLAAGAYYSGFLSLFERLGPSGLRIVVYHRVQPGRIDDGMTVSQEIFAAQLRHLKTRYQVISLDDVPALLARDRLPSRRLVAITYDDGYRDNYEIAWPLLKHHALPATIFLTVGAIDQHVALWSETLREAVWACSKEVVSLQAINLGRWPLRSEAERAACYKGLGMRLKALPDAARHRLLDSVLEELRGSGQRAEDHRMLTWDMIREMREGGISFGAHTLSHPFLANLSDTEAKSEIVESKRRIEEELGESVRHFAYPNGTVEDCTPRVREMIRAAGLETAATAVEGSNPVGQDLHLLYRIEVSDVGCTDPFGRFSPAMYQVTLAGLFRRWNRPLH